MRCLGRQGTPSPQPSEKGEEDGVGPGPPRQPPPPPPPLQDGAVPASRGEAGRGRSAAEKQQAPLAKVPSSKTKVRGKLAFECF